MALTQEPNQSGGAFDLVYGLSMNVNGSAGTKNGTVNSAVCVRHGGI